MPKPLWACPGCDYEVRCDPLGCDDWGGEEVAIGPDCPDCDESMDFVVEEEESDAK